MAAVAGPLPARHPSPPRRPHSHHSKPAVHTKPATYIQTTAPIPDPYYGHEETAKICARFISGLFSCPDTPPPPPPPPPSASSTQPPSPPLAQFIAYALHRTRLHNCVTFTALYLLSRLKNRFPAARGSSGHRLFISAFMIASKVVCDDTYSNKSWCVVGQGMFSLREINQMEREMCGYLEWHLNFDPSELEQFEIKVRKDYGGNGRNISALTRPAVPPINTSVSRLPSSVAKRDIMHPYPSPPNSPSPSPPTPPSSHSANSSPESTTCLTPPSDNGLESAVVTSAGPPNVPGIQSSVPILSAAAAIPPAPPKTNNRESGFAFAAPAVW